LADGVLALQQDDEAGEGAQPSGHSPELNEKSALAGILDSTLERLAQAALLVG
jgi:hypothetical protein